MFETPLRYALPYKYLASGENVKPFGTDCAKSKRASGVVSPFFKASMFRTRTSCLPVISPNDADSLAPSGDTSRS